MSKLLAGVAKAVINPPVGVDLSGYASRTSGSTGIHDDLHAKALVISDGSTKAAVVTLDLVGIDARQVADLRAEISSKTDVPMGNILISASHTHTGPATQELRVCGRVHEPYVRDLLKKITLTVEEAEKCMQPAEFGYSVGRANIAVNRRLRTQTGETHLMPNPAGVTDPDVGVWYFRNMKGEPIAILFNYACHAVVIGDVLEISADWPGVAQRTVEQDVGGQAMFLQGCCGNINPRERFSWQIVEKLGREVADAVKNVLPDIHLTSDVKISVAREVIELPLQPPPSREELERIIAETEKSMQASEPTSTDWRINAAYNDWAKTLLTGESKPSISTEVFRLRLGDYNIVTLPGEAFVEYALQIKAMKPNTIVAAYSNGNIGYVPIKSAFPEKGYEVEVAYKLYGEQMITDDAEDLILTAACRLLT
ncbi:MAG: neutral/alkaline non-lysosomal ceramidase N-terminal domain-containing protein [Armatimonadetes bacterium]|nr:neutral/alkaline non-lysosomal ceramidase N-terminal domain-containing protein [Armatimonadota bacterium]